MLHHIWYRDCVKHVSYVETGNKCLANDVILSRKVRPGNSLSVNIMFLYCPSKFQAHLISVLLSSVLIIERTLTLVPFL